MIWMMQALVMPKQHTASMKVISAIITGTTLGKFTSSPGLVLTDTYSGTIDLDASIPGTYIVTYTTLDIIKDGLVLYLDTENQILFWIGKYMV